MIIRIAFAFLSLVLLFAAPASAQQQSIGQAISAAMGEAMKDPRYEGVLEKYFLPLPDMSDPKLASSVNMPYPAVDKGSLLEQVIERGELRIGWIGVGIPWSQPGPDGDPIGLSIDFWEIVLDKMGSHYGVEIASRYVEYDSEIGNNDMYKWLASDADRDCVALNLPSPDNCYDVIGGAYAINERRKGISAVTPAYYPLNLSAVRTPAPVKDPAVALDSAEQVRAAAGNADLGLVFAALPATGEENFLKGMMRKTGETFSIVIRDPKSNVLEFAENTEANFVMGTNVRFAVTRTKTPQFCADCEVIPNMRAFDGVGFATYLPSAAR